MDQIESKSRRASAVAPELFAPARHRSQEPRVLFGPGRVTSAVVHVRDLRLRTYIGFNPEEKAKRQDVVINIELRYALAAGVFDDQVADALDYKRVTKSVIQLVEDGRFLLLEKLAFEVLTICSAPPGVMHARIRIDKPHALRFADSVSVTLEYSAGDNESAQENLR